MALINERLTTNFLFTLSTALLKATIPSKRSIKRLPKHSTRLIDSNTSPPSTTAANARRQD